MKKLLLSLVIVLMFNIKGHSQGMPVYDNTSFIALGQQLFAMAQQTGEVIKTVNFLKEQKERIEQVSNAINDFNTVARLIERNQDIYRMLNVDVRGLIQSPLVKDYEAERLIGRVNKLYELSLQDIQLVKKILQSNFLKMEDTERMKELRDAEKRADETVDNLKSDVKRYQNIIDMREFQKKVDDARSQR